MKLFKNDKQRENVAKYCYDISKLLAVTCVITPFIQGESILDIIVGILSTIGFFVVGYIIDCKEYKK